MIDLIEKRYDFFVVCVEESLLAAALGIIYNSQNEFVHITNWKRFAEMRKKHTHNWWILDISALTWVVLMSA